MSKVCNHCGTMLADDEKFCPNCGAKVEEVKEVVKEAEVYTSNNETTTNTGAPTKTNGMAIASMICGIVGLVVAALWLGITAICLSIAAKNRMKVFPNEKGKGMATAGLVLGIIDVAFGVIGIFASLFIASWF